MQIAVVLIPNVAEIFKLVPLNTEQWIYTIAISFAPIVIMELQKKFNEIKYGKVVYPKSLSGKRNVENLGHLINR